MEKIAFWACVLRVLDGIGGIITLTIFDGAPSQDIVIATTEWVVIGIILATRSRWAPLVSSVLSTIVLYLTFTQPYLIQSVSNPKGPVGGYGHFFGEVLALACEIVVVGASLGAAVQKHFPGSKQARHATNWMPAGMTLAIGMLLGAMSQPYVATSVTTTNGTSTIHITVTNFSQPSVTIAKGSKLVLEDDSPIAHDIYNGSWQNGTSQVQREPGAPLVSNVQLSANTVTIGPFTTAGTYHIMCTIHQGMNLTIIVQ